MSDPTAPDRHARHDKALEDHDTRIGNLEVASTKEIVWRTGDEMPHRGAESRLYHLEQEAVLHSEMKQIAAEIVSAYLRSFRGILQTAAPYVMAAIGVAYLLLTGHPLGKP